MYFPIIQLGSTLRTINKKGPRTSNLLHAFVDVKPTGLVVGSIQLQHFLKRAWQGKFGIILEMRTTDRQVAAEDLRPVAFMCDEYGHYILVPDVESYIRQFRASTKEMKRLQVVVFNDSNTTRKELEQDAKAQPFMELWRPADLPLDLLKTAVIRWEVGLMIREEEDVAAFEQMLPTLTKLTFDNITLLVAPGLHNAVSALVGKTPRSVQKK